MNICIIKLLCLWLSRMMILMVGFQYSIVTANGLHKNYTYDSIIFFHHYYALYVSN